MYRKDSKYSPGYKLSIIKASDTLEDAINSLNKSGLMVCCVVDSEARIVGLLTDSDIRRLMLKAVPLDRLAADVCNKKPLICDIGMPTNELVELAKQEGKREIPIVGPGKTVEDVFILGIAEEKIVDSNGQTSFCASKPIDAEMFILAGGLGTRLRSVVSDKPKPLAEVGDAAIIEHVINHAVACGVPKFYFSLNYKAEMIEKHVSEKYKNQIKYEFVREPIRLGTAGPLSLVSGKINKPLFVVNADLLTDLDYRNVYLDHVNSKSDITVVVRRHSLNIPYGEVHLKNGLIDKVVEKPSKSYLINAGIYILQPSVLKLVPRGQYFDMPDYITELIARKKVLKPFFMHEEWIDIGKPEDYKKANSFFPLGSNISQVEY